jgi:hypothetical protein
MTCLRCGIALSTKQHVVVWLPDGTFRCFPCWLQERPLSV